jgi:rhodanese-related sulfurtransferase
MTTNQDLKNIKVKKLKPSKVKSLAGKEDYYILDVRPLDFKRDTSFIRGSSQCPLVHLAAHYQQIPKDQKIVITDWAMKQSPTAAKFLTSKGYSVVGVLKGGLERWKSENLPVENRDPSFKIESLNLSRNN